MRKGFTLIELMIVIAIIAVIAAIAIPNLLQASIAGNETTAVTSLRGIASAQGIFKRTDWYRVGFKSYSNGARDLYTLTDNDGATRNPGLIDRSLADGFGDDATKMVGNTTTDKIAKAGYVFIDNSLKDGTNDVDLTIPTVPVNTYDYCGYPAQFEQTGRQTFVMNTGGTVYGKDLGSTSVNGCDYPASVSDWIASQ